MEGRLDEERVRLLRAEGLTLNSLRLFVRRINIGKNNCQAVMQSKILHGHCNVASTYPHGVTPGHWAEKQRRLFDEEKLYHACHKSSKEESLSLILAPQRSALLRGKVDTMHSKTNMITSKFLQNT